MNMTTAPESPEAAHLEKLRSQLSTDMEAMQQKEASLREYEQRLRVLVDHAPSSRPPQQSAPQYFVAAPNNNSGLDAEWEKYNRAHALLEAARRGLCDDRLALKDREERLQVREVEASRREAWVKVREQELEALAQARAKQEAEVKARPTFSSAPFLAARNLFTRHA
jgi:chromosome segregation ATPase